MAASLAAVTSHGLLGAGGGGSCDYPATGSVLYPVVYGNGLYTGTFGAPDPSATSVLDRILSAVVSKVQLNGIAVEDTLPTVVKRKLPKKEDGVDAAYQVTVSGAEMADRIKRIAFGSRFLVVYQIEVTLITPADNALTNLGAVTVWREATRASLMAPAPLSGVPEVTRIEIDQAPLFDRAAFNLNYDYDQIVIIVTTYEDRS